MVWCGVWARRKGGHVAETLHAPRGSSPTDRPVGSRRAVHGERGGERAGVTSQRRRHTCSKGTESLRAFCADCWDAVLSQEPCDARSAIPAGGRRPSARRRRAGDEDGGERADTGHWFSHTHLQVLTERAIDEDRMLQGYVRPADVPDMGGLFPTPYPMFRVD